MSTITHRFPLWLLCLTLINPMFARGAETWPGYESGTRSWNSSPTEISLESLSLLWARSFTSPKFGGNAWRPEPEINPEINAYLHSRNLVYLDGYLALVATNSLPEEKHAGAQALLTVLSAEDGTTRNVVGVRLDKGNNGMRGKYPEYPVFNGAENFHGAANVWWDPETRILYLASPGDSPTHSAYRPLANLASWQPGAWQPGVAAFTDLQEAHPAIQDVFGHPRDSAVEEASGNPHDETADAWGLDLRFAKRGEHKEQGDDPAKWLIGVPGWNRSAFFAVDEDGPLLMFHHSAGHGQTGHPMFVNKHTGQLVYNQFLPKADNWPELSRPFLRWGGSLIGEERVFFFGPYGGAGGKFVGRSRPAQDLVLWSYAYTVVDQQPNDGANGDIALDTLKLQPSFYYHLKSRGDGDTAPSWVELDGFYRNKAALLDRDDTLWMAWKPAQDEPVELVRADPEGCETFSLEIGKGLKGHDLWPHISRTQQPGSGSGFIVYYHGVGQVRDRTEILTMKSGKERKRPAWSSDRKPPRGPAELAVFDLQTRRTTGTVNLTTAFPHLPPNPFWGYLERSHMVVAGHHAIIGWVETAAAGHQNAQLTLAIYDVRDLQKAPEIRRFDLGFSATAYPNSILNGMITVDGVVYAHVLQSNNLAVNRTEWSAQHVLALSGGR